METGQGKPAIDLSQPVPYEDFAFAVNAVWMTVGMELAERYDWCEAWISYVHSLAPGLFPGIESTETDTSSIGYERAVPFTPDDKFPAENNAETLRLVRARVLYYVTVWQISVDDANEIFAAARLPLYEPQNAGLAVHGVLLADTEKPAGLAVG